MSGEGFRDAPGCRKATHEQNMGPFPGIPSVSPLQPECQPRAWEPDLVFCCGPRDMAPVSSTAPVVMMPCEDSTGLVFLVRSNSGKLPAWLGLL